MEYATFRTAISGAVSRCPIRDMRWEAASVVRGVRPRTSARSARLYGCFDRALLERRLRAATTRFELDRVRGVFEMSLECFNESFRKDQFCPFRAR